MRRGVLSLLAMALALPVLYGAARGTYPLETAALRLVVLAVSVSVIDRYLGPLMTALLRLLDGQPVAKSPSERAHPNR